MAEDVSRGVYEFTNGRAPKGKVPILPMCPWEAYTMPIVQDVLDATGMKSIDPSLQIQPWMSFPLQEAIRDYCRFKNAAYSHLQKLRREKKEAERRIQKDF